MSKSGSLGWMLARILIFVLLAAGVFGAVIYKTMQDEEALIQRENAESRIRDFDPNAVENGGAAPGGGEAGGGERRRRPRPAANEGEAPATAPATPASEAPTANETPATDSVPAADAPKPDAAPAE